MAEIGTQLENYALGEAGNAAGCADAAAFDKAGDDADAVGSGKDFNTSIMLERSSIVGFRIKNPPGSGVKEFRLTHYSGRAEWKHRGPRRTT